MSGTLFTDLITSEHINKPKFVATVGGLTQGFVDTLSQFNYYPTLFSVDDAVGAQLDVIGEWVGIARNIFLSVDAYFSWDTSGVGWDQGIWWEVGDAESVVTKLPDEEYRMMIKLKIACNTFDGTLPTALGIISDLVSADGCTVSATEGDMPVAFTITGTISSVTRALITGGYLPLKPAGVAITYTFNEG